MDREETITADCGKRKPQKVNLNILIKVDKAKCKQQTDPCSDNNNGGSGASPDQSCCQTLPCGCVVAYDNCCCKSCWAPPQCCGEYPTAYSTSEQESGASHTNGRKKSRKKSRKSTTSSACQTTASSIPKSKRGKSKEKNKTKTNERSMQTHKGAGAGGGVSTSGSPESCIPTTCPSRMSNVPSCGSIKLTQLAKSKEVKGSQTTTSISGQADSKKPSPQKTVASQADKRTSSSGGKYREKENEEYEYSKPPKSQKDSTRQSTQVQASKRSSPPNNSAPVKTVYPSRTGSGEGQPTTTWQDEPTLCSPPDGQTEDRNSVTGNQIEGGNGGRPSMGAGGASEDAGNENVAPSPANKTMNVGEVNDVNEGATSTLVDQSTKAVSSRKSVSKKASGASSTRKLDEGNVGGSEEAQPASDPFAEDGKPIAPGGNIETDYSFVAAEMTNEVTTEGRLGSFSSEDGGSKVGGNTGDGDGKGEGGEDGDFKSGGSRRGTANKLDSYGTEKDTGNARNSMGEGESSQVEIKDAVEEDKTDPKRSDQTGPEMSDETGPRMSDETGPEMSDQTGPKMSDQTGPEMTDETGPKISDETDPKMSHETGPKRSIQTGPKRSIQTDSKRSIQTDSKRSSQTDSKRSIQTDSKRSIQTDSKRSIQTDSKRSIQTDSKRSIQTDSKRSIQTDPKRSIQTDPKRSIQTDSKRSIQTGPEMSDETDPGMSDETGPEMSDETGPEMSDETGLEMSDDTGPEMSDETDPKRSNDVGQRRDVYVTQSSYYDWGWESWDRTVSLLTGDPYNCNPCAGETCDEGGNGNSETRDGYGGGLQTSEVRCLPDPSCLDYALLIAVPLIILGLLSSVESC